MFKEPWLEYASDLQVEVEQAHDQGLAVEVRLFSDASLRLRARMVFWIFHTAF